MDYIFRLFLLLPFLFIIQDNNCFKLITTLYNETKEERIKEYLECVERNLAHPAIDEIHVLYDTIRDTDQGSIILEYLKGQNVTISYISGRPSFAQLFDYANQHFPHQRVIVSNADIYFNETLLLLKDFNFTNRFLALTRWDLHKDGTLHLLLNAHGKPNVHSQDSWFFQTPLRKINCQKIKMGILRCDCQLAYQVARSGLDIYNPCYSIQCCHLHLSELRTDDREDSAEGLKLQTVPWIKLEDIH